MAILAAFHIHKIKALFERHLPNQNDYFKQLQWTKKLNIAHDDKSLLWLCLKHIDETRNMADDMVEERCKFDLQDFSRLVSYLPNLKEINFKDCYHKALYMALLRDIDSSKYLKRIEKISGGEEENGPMVNFATYYNFRATLKHLVFHYIEGATLTLNE